MKLSTWKIIRYFFELTLSLFGWLWQRLHVGSSIVYSDQVLWRWLLGSVSVRRFEDAAAWLGDP